MKIHAALTIAAALLLGACATPDTVQNVCDRMVDECHLTKPGISTRDCVEKLDKALDGFSTSERKDVERMWDDCLGYDSCGAFASCLGLDK
jgi:hypothetical protein